MKLLFAHDHYFQKNANGDLFTGGTFNSKVWQRYLDHFDSVTVAARLQNNDEDLSETHNIFDNPNTDFLEIPNTSGLKNIFKNKSKAKNILRNEIKKSDAVIARLPSEIGNLAVSIAIEENKPYAVEVVACVWDGLWNHGSIFGKLYAPWAMFKMKKRIKYSPYALYVTESFLQKRYPTQGITTNVSNVEINSINHDSLETRLTNVRNKNYVKIGMIGSLKNNIKGWTIAFKALSNLKQNGINFEFEILGAGDTEPWELMLADLELENEVRFLGLIPGGKPVLDWLDNIDIYIQPSFQEGLPRAVIEAMSRGCPVIGSNAGGIPELLNKDFIHKKGDYSKLTSLLIKLINNDDLFEFEILRNIEKSNYYLKNNLDLRRKEFWSMFVENIK